MVPPARQEAPPSQAALARRLAGASSGSRRRGAMAAEGPEAPGSPGRGEAEETLGDGGDGGTGAPGASGVSGEPEGERQGGTRA